MLGTFLPGQERLACLAQAEARIQFAANGREPPHHSNRRCRFREELIMIS